MKTKILKQNLNIGSKRLCLVNSKIILEAWFSAVTRRIYVLFLFIRITNLFFKKWGWTCFFFPKCPDVYLWQWNLILSLPLQQLQSFWMSSSAHVTVCCCLVKLKKNENYINRKCSTYSFSVLISSSTLHYDPHCGQEDIHTHILVDT